jgi:D-aspartate ligase
MVVGGNVAGLGVVRSLSITGAPVMVLDTSFLNAALWSRHCEGRVIASLSGSQLIDELKAAGSRFAQRPLLVLTQDATVETVSRWRDDLEPYYRFLLPPPDIVDLFNDKGEFHDFAMREKFSVPESVVVRCIDDLVRIEALQLPVIVKPARKIDLQESGLDRAARFDRVEDATAHCVALMKLKASAIVQEWVDGPDDQIFFCLFFCDRSGQPLRFFTGRKLSAYPAGVGSTATCIAAPEAHAELKALTVRLTSMTRYAGIGGLECEDRRIYHHRTDGWTDRLAGGDCDAVGRQHSGRCMDACDGTIDRACRHSLDRVRVAHFAEASQPGNAAEG